MQHHLAFPLRRRVVLATYLLTQLDVRHVLVRTRNSNGARLEHSAASWTEVHRRDSYLAPVFCAL